jgi:serine/threonine-protein kinase
MIDPKKICPGCMGEKLAEGKCPVCGYNPDEPINPSYLKPSSLLEGRYIIGKVLDQNGEGVTYLGFDSVTSAVVNIREFFPVGLCERADDESVLMKAGFEYDYNDALIKFLELSKTLFKLNELPALFDILDIREANGTAYRITRSVPGISLREFLMRNGNTLKWDQARSLFVPLISSISALHKVGIIHRGISPDTLFVSKDGKLRINGFCIADERTAKSPLTSQLFPGFAAVEQYGDAGVQGTWTDVYAFAATIYRTLVGSPPPEATSRLESDNMTIPAVIARETPKSVLETLANALQVLPDDRTRSIDEMRKGLSISSVAANGTGVVAAGTVQKHTSETAQNGKPKSKSKKNTGKIYGLVAGIATAFLLAVIIFFVLWFMGVFDKNDTESGNSINNGLNSVASTESVASKVPVEDETKFSSLPDFEKNEFSDIAYDPQFANIYKFKISSKQYSDSVPAGRIISQTPAPNTVVEEGTTVEFVVSLGSYYIQMINVTGKSADDALLELLKAGFDYDNIVFTEKWDDTKPPATVVETEPAKGVNINTDMRIEVFINSYQGEPATPGTGNENITE